MTALAANANVPKQSIDPEPEFFEFPVEASTTIYGGAMVAVNAAGNAVPASAVQALKVLGRADAPALNGSGAAGAVKVRIRRGIFRLQNSTAGDAITAAAHRMRNVYAADDATVAATSNTNARPVAGYVVDVDSSGVWVHLGKSAPLQTPQQKGIATLVAGVATVTLRTLSAESQIFLQLATTGGTIGTAGYKVAAADVTVGIGTGQFVIRAIDEAGTAATGDTSTVRWTIVD